MDVLRKSELSGGAAMPGNPPVKSRAASAWSLEDVETLIEMWNMRFTNEEIADVLERGPNAIAVKASRLNLPPRNAPVKLGKIRPCLRCATSFFSEGSGHRICDTCKSSDDWQSSGDGSYSVLEP